MYKQTASQEEVAECYKLHMQRSGMQTGGQGLLDSICRDLAKRPLLVPNFRSSGVAAPNKAGKGSAGGLNTDLIAAAAPKALRAADALLAPVCKQPGLRCSVGPAGPQCNHAISTRN